QAPAENGGFLHVSGMQFTYDSEKDPGSRVVEMYVENNGDLEEIQLDAEYQVTTNGFTGQGGDGFETFAQAYDEGRVKDIGEIDWQQLVDYMVEEEYLGGVVDPEREGRIVDLQGEAPNVPISTEDILGAVTTLEDDGEILNEDAARALNMHLTVVGQYEEQDLRDKVIKHMEGFKELVNYQKENGLISGAAHGELQTMADTLIDQ